MTTREGVVERGAYAVVMVWADVAMIVVVFGEGGEGSCGFG